METDFTVNSHPGDYIDLDYRAIRITVFKNGDMFDDGKSVVLSRRRFKHWLTFLDFLTVKLELLAPVHQLYRVDGLLVQHVITSHICFTFIQILAYFI